VSVTIDVPSDSLNSNKDRGNYHSDVNVLGIAYKQDDTVGARFSDTLELDLTNEEWRQFTKQFYHYQNQFAVALGRYRVVVVFSAGRKHFGKFETPIQIVPHLGKTITLGGVVLSINFQKLDHGSNPLDAMLVVKLRVQDLPAGSLPPGLAGRRQRQLPSPQKEIEFTISN